MVMGTTVGRLARKSPEALVARIPTFRVIFSEEQKR